MELQKNCKPLFAAEDICKACNGELFHGRPEARAEGVSTDSRNIQPREAFFALLGPNFDAHDYIPDAIKSGASIVVVQNTANCREIPKETNVIRVEDTLHALTRLAAWHKNRLQGKVIAVTGSCGKSTVKEMTGAILSKTGKCTVAKQSFNNRIGVSLTLLDAVPDDDYVVVELGANHQGEIDELAAIVRPDAGCITCIGECHLEGFGSVEGVKEAKSELISHIHENGLLVLNADDPRCLELRDRFSGQVKTFGLSKSADFRPVELKSGNHGELFKLNEYVFHLPVLGAHNILNASAAFCLAHWAGASGHEAIEALPRLQLPKLRSEKREINGVEYILDCYNSNPTAMRAAARTFSRMQSPGRRIMVCGDMLELGASSVELHEKTGRMIAESGIDLLFAVGDFAHSVVAGWRMAAREANNAIMILNPEKAWHFLHRLCKPGDTVMVKGSRKLGLEKMVESIDEYVSGMKQEVA